MSDEHGEDGFSHHCPKCNHHNPTMCVVTGQVKGLKAVARDRAELVKQLTAMVTAMREQVISVRQRDGIDGVACLVCDAWANADYNLVHVPRCAFSSPPSG